MGQHLEYERISVLLTESGSRAEQRHLEACSLCRSEFEYMSRMRMALSALPEEAPSPGAWGKIEAALEGADATGRPDSIELGEEGVTLARAATSRRMPGAPWMKAAAAVVLFAGGVYGGIAMSELPDSEGVAGVPREVVSSGDDRVLLEGLSEIESLRAGNLLQVGDDLGNRVSDNGPSRRDPGPTTLLANDPLAAAQYLAQLDGSIRALREHLATDPDDPVANAYLLELVQQRRSFTQNIDGAVGTSIW